MEILRAIAATCRKQKPLRGLDAAHCEARTAIALEASVIWEKEIRGTPQIDAEGQLRPTVRPEYLLAPLDAATDADDLGTLAGTLVSMRYLDLFVYKLPLISGGRIMTDFSDEPANLNQTTKIPRYERSWFPRL